MLCSVFTVITVQRFLDLFIHKIRYKLRQLMDYFGGYNDEGNYGLIEHAILHKHKY